jgi:hypothetical protein
MSIFTIPLSVAETTIINDIINHSNKEGSPKSPWYVGIASNPEDRLFKDHNVLKEGGWWIYRNAGSESSARKIEQFLIERYGFSGGSGGGDSATQHVYAYRKTNSTIE